MRGVVAAGHQVTAEAGADVLRAGGNAVDAAVASVLVSFASESLLTGPGAGGFMLLTSPSGRSHLLDFFVSAPGRGLQNPEPAPLVPVEVAFSPETIQVFNVGASSCGAYGNPAGLAYALERYGTMGLGDLTPAAAKAAREGVASRRSRSTCCASWGRSSVPRPRARRCTNPAGTRWWRASACPCPSWPICSTAWAPRARASCTRATWPTPSATGCCSAVGC